MVIAKVSEKVVPITTTTPSIKAAPQGNAKFVQKSEFVYANGPRSKKGKKTIDASAKSLIRGQIRSIGYLSTKSALSILIWGQTLKVQIVKPDPVAKRVLEMHAIFQSKTIQWKTKLEIMRAGIWNKVDLRIRLAALKGLASKEGILFLARQDRYGHNRQRLGKLAKERINFKSSLTDQVACRRLAAAILKAVKKVRIKDKKVRAARRRKACRAIEKRCARKSPDKFCIRLYLSDRDIRRAKRLKCNNVPYTSLDDIKLKPAN